MKEWGILKTVRVCLFPGGCVYRHPLILQLSLIKHAEMLILEARVQLNACQKTIRNRQIKWLCNQYCKGKRA